MTQVRHARLFFRVFTKKRWSTSSKRSGYHNWSQLVSVYSANRKLTDTPRLFNNQKLRLMRALGNQAPFWTKPLPFWEKKKFNLPTDSYSGLHNKKWNIFPSNSQLFIFHRWNSTFFIYALKFCERQTFVSYACWWATLVYHPRRWPRWCWEKHEECLAFFDP